jgi:hypothetical protein
MKKPYPSAPTLYSSETVMLFIVNPPHDMPLISGFSSLMVILGSVKGTKKRDMPL